ncbi:uncharacterized protein LOC131860108 [Cryptomeria japonica]|uniref:uncharacterized protein LOC131860108 n=1 Tax=Cryptomeria japonica TaxID=3369 RepID=UPI0027DA911A|nr:uncharacterized protein LOC131860108 [Cryptomeria japonica]
MECSLRGDVGFQVYLFQCRKCLIRFQHQYCSRSYYEKASAKSMSEVCHWCFTIQEEDVGSDAKVRIRDSVKRMRSSAGFGECTNMTQNSKAKRDLRKSRVEIEGQIASELKKQRNPEIIYSTERRVGKKYKLLDEIVC